MKNLVITILGASLLLFANGIALAQTARARIADTPIRGEANLASAIIATLNEGAAVDVVDLQGDWYRVLVPNDQGKARVGYVLSHLIEILNTDGSPQPVHASPTSRGARPNAQGAFIPPTVVQGPPQRDKAHEREQEASRAEIDRLQAELKVLENDPAMGQGRSRPLPQAVAQHPQVREGFWFNAGFGVGSLGCANCGSTLTGASGGLSLGGTINDRLLLGGGTTGYYRSDVGGTLSVGTLDARLRFYPVRTSGFFVTGGLGLGTISIGGVSETGVGVILGLGWDIRVRSNLSLTPFWNGYAITTSNLNANVGQLGIGLTIHHGSR